VAMSQYFVLSHRHFLCPPTLKTASNYAGIPTKTKKQLIFLLRNLI
jgi:hypothetical protein